MIELNQNLLIEIADDINDVQNKEARKQDLERWLMYNGKTQDIIKESIKKEFNRPETVEELIARLVPLNIIQKIINKLAGVYVEAPLREVVDENEADLELMELYEEAASVNSRFKEANRYFKLFKRNLMEPFVDHDGVPGLRNLPRHTYEVYSFNSMRPDKPDLIAIIKHDDELRDNQVIKIWTADNHILIDGNGKVLRDKMEQMGNVDGINPYGRIPFVYINESTYSVNPLSDDDLMRMAIAIPVVLTDLLFACKYQCWSIIYTVGDVGELPSNPSSVIAMDYGPDGQEPKVGTIKPEIDINAILQLIANLISTLLTTKNLAAGTIKTTQGINETISGISKALDNAESVEDKKDQQSYFMKAEADLWDLLANYMIPVWRKLNKLAPEYNKEFSPAFAMSVLYREPKVLISEKERIENAKAKLEAGLSTLERELANLNPDMSDNQIQKLKEEILAEQNDKMNAQVEAINGEELEPEV